MTVYVIQLAINCRFLLPFQPHSLFSFLIRETKTFNKAVSHERQITMRKLLLSYFFKNEKIFIIKIWWKLLIFLNFSLSLSHHSNKSDFYIFIKSHVQSFLHARWRKFSFASQTNAFDYKFVQKLILAKGLVYFQLMVFRFDMLSLVNLLKCTQL